MKVSTDACLFGAYIADFCIQQKWLPERVLDIGTGTGLLTLMLAQKNNKAFFTGVELDKKASEQAKENVFASPWTNRIQILNQDIVKWNESNEQDYDLLICNPPFFSQHLLSNAENRLMARHDEHLSLEQIKNIGNNCLNNEGRLALLLPNSRLQECLNLFADSFQIESVLETADREGKSLNRVVIILVKSIRKVDATREVLFLHDASGKRSDRWQDLIQDYYLR